MAGACGLQLEHFFAIVPLSLAGFITALRTLAPVWIDLAMHGSEQALFLLLRQLQPCAVRSLQATSKVPPQA